MSRWLDPELEQWPLEDDERSRIHERRISMFGRTNWNGYPKGFPKLGRTGTAVFLYAVLPVACLLSVVGLVAVGSPDAAYAFGLTFLAEAGILAVIFRDRRRNLTRAAAAELGHPVCLNCGFFNLGHERGDTCCECGARMPELPNEHFPPAEEDETVQALKDQRRRLPKMKLDAQRRQPTERPT